MTDHERWLLVYDGDCGFCRGSVAWVLARNAKGVVDARPFQQEGVLERADLSREQARRAAWLVAPDGRRWSGADAAARVLRLLPRWGTLGKLLGADPVAWIARRAYRWIADHRPLMARLTGISCEYGRPEEPVDPERCGGSTAGGRGATQGTAAPSSADEPHDPDWS